MPAAPAPALGSLQVRNVAPRPGIGRPAPPQTPLSPQSPPTAQSSLSSSSSPSKSPPPAYERIQHVLLSQASVAAATAAASAVQQQSQSQAQFPLLPAFPPRRPLRHQFQAQLAQQHSFQPRFRELQTSSTNASAFLSASAISSAPTTQPASAPIATAGAAAAATMGTTARMQSGVGAGTLFDGLWRGMLERVYNELGHVHTLYAGTLRKEQQEKEVFRAHCIRLKGERDLAREKLRRALGRQYDDGTQPPAVVEPSTTAAAAPAGETAVDDRTRTPPLSASPTMLAFPASSSSSSVTPGADQVSSRIMEDFVSSPEQGPNELVDVRSYPSPSPSCSSPPPSRSPIAQITTSPFSPVGCSDLQPNSGFDRAVIDVDAAAALNSPDDSDMQERKRERYDESEPERSAKKQRTQDSEASDGTTTTMTSSSQGVDVAADLDRQASRCDDSQSNEAIEENATVTAPEGTASSSSTPTLMASGSAGTGNRWNFPFDLMYMLADDKLVCRVCSYKHARCGVPGPKGFSRTTTWEELVVHCEQQHPAACAEVAGMAPGEVMELRQRMMTVAGCVNTSCSR